ncbi:hypothetical protein M5K25_016096 [Dendrobium thyrsiflorum]|uniref:Uncharacterized protein n=1 Tax=Dendrobium thyrsiflorum TaxID=117978 RepID=A0ABD0US04_DENTH
MAGSIGVLGLAQTCTVWVNLGSTQVKPGVDLGRGGEPRAGAPNAGVGWAQLCLRWKMTQRANGLGLKYLKIPLGRVSRPWSLALEYGFGSWVKLELRCRTRQLTSDWDEETGFSWQNNVINTGSTGATNQFGGLEFSADTVRATTILVYNVDSKGPIGRLLSARTTICHAHLLAS